MENLHHANTNVEAFVKGSAEKKVQDYFDHPLSVWLTSDEPNLVSFKKLQTALKHKHHRSHNEGKRHEAHCALEATKLAGFKTKWNAYRFCEGGVGK